MLDILLNMYPKADKTKDAEEILKNDYNITLRSFCKEVDSMCNLSQGIYNDGKIEGEIIKAIKVVKNLLAKGFSLEEALSIADIDKETYEKNCSDEEQL